MPHAPWPASRSCDAAAAEVRVPRRSLVVVAGLPGAGKTTLVRRLAPTPGVVALDSEDVAHALAALPLPYRTLRPVVHVLHVLRLLVTLLTSADCVVSSDPLTSSHRQRCFAAAAALTGRRLVVVLVHAHAQDARDGQRRRGRVLTEARMTRHEQRYARRLQAGLLHDADGARVLTRQQAEHARISWTGDDLVGGCASELPGSSTARAA